MTGATRRPTRNTSDAGRSVTELLVAMAIAAGAVSFGIPATAHVRDDTTARQASAYLAAQLRSAQQDAIATSRQRGVVFDATSQGWTFRVCEDGNRNGLRRADIDDQVDRCSAGPFRISTMFPGVTVDVDPTLRGPDGEPASPDPVRLGRSNIASFSSSGTGTAGSVFLRGAGGQHVIVRVTGVSGRVRVLRHNPATRVWEPW